MSTPAKYPVAKTAKRIWHTPRSRLAWFWFWFSLICCGILFGLDAFDLIPEFSRISHGGIPAFLIVLMVATYSLRARFMRNLPGKAQSWLWFHMWMGLAALLIAGMHEGCLVGRLQDCGRGPSTPPTGHLGMLALYSLIGIVGSGIAGRLLDWWQARVIVQEANSNGVGTVGAVRSRLLELEYVVERLCAGKSQNFKQYCEQAIRSAGEPPRILPGLMPQEQADFLRAYAALCDHARLKASLAKQVRALRIFRIWRQGHTAFAPLALLIITYHAFTEVMKEIFHLALPLWFP